MCYSEKNFHIYLHIKRPTNEIVLVRSRYAAKSSFKLGRHRCPCTYSDFGWKNCVQHSYICQFCIYNRETNKTKISAKPSMFFFISTHHCQHESVLVIYEYLLFLEGRHFQTLLYMGNHLTGSSLLVKPPNHMTTKKGNSSKISTNLDQPTVYVYKSG